METKIYAIYDSVANAYMQPMYFTNDGMALRTVQQQVNNNKDSFLHKNPQDFTLYQLGEYLDDSGSLVPLETPRKVVHINELREENNIDKDQLDLFRSEIKATREVVNSLKTLVVGKNQAS